MFREILMHVPADNPNSLTTPTVSIITVTPSTTTSSKTTAAKMKGETDVKPSCTRPNVLSKSCKTSKKENSSSKAVAKLSLDNASELSHQEDTNKASPLLTTTSSTPLASVSNMLMKATSLALSQSSSSTKIIQSNDKGTKSSAQTERSPGKEAIIPVPYTAQPPEQVERTTVGTGGRGKGKERRFICQLCTATYTFRTNLTRHMRQKHGRDE